MIRAPVAGLRPTLTLETSRYLVRVRRLRVGDRFIAFDPEARTEAEATLVDERTISLSEVRAATVVAEQQLALVYCLAKGDKVDDVVRDATELGASRVIVARASRSVVKADAERAEAKRARWLRIAEQAARQCGRGDTPAVEGILDWKDALARASSCDARFVLDPHATERLGPLLQTSLASGASVAFAIGPEGGLTLDEIAEASDAGFLAASLGRFVLRTETVAAAVLGAVMLAGHP